MWGYSCKKQTSVLLTLQYVKVLVKVCLCWFWYKYMLLFIILLMSSNWYNYLLLVYYRNLIFVQFFLFFVFIYWLIYLFCNTGVVIFQFLLLPVIVSFSSSHSGKWNTATYDTISLPWKQSRFYLWTFCSLRRKDQGLTVSSLDFIRFMLFKL